MTKPFDPNDRIAIQNAILLKNPDDPVWRALDARIKDLALIVGKTVADAADMPATVDIPWPETALDAVATALFRAELADIDHAPALRIVKHRVQ